MITYFPMISNAHIISYSIKRDKLSKILSPNLTLILVYKLKYKETI